MQDTFALWNLLAHLLVDVKIRETNPNCRSADWNFAWTEAMRLESEMRTKLSAISFLTTASIAYDFTGGIRGDTTGLRLPCSQAEWEARDATQWDVAWRHTTPKQSQMLFDDAMQCLLTHRGAKPPLQPLPTSFGTYLLIHGLIQRIMVVRELHLILRQQPAPLPTTDIETLQ